ncbi:MAG TPA: DinB family protein [Mucilaginibacter sp.]|nr:DinB family protein [Mucilaginibacter sp.]
MKEYFKKLIDYDHYENGVITDILLHAGSPEKPEQIIAHTLAAQQIWLTRCKREPAIGGALWPGWKADSFKRIIDENYDGWTTFLDTLEPADFEQMIPYNNSKGESFENKLNDILTHLINHGTHHRAQAGQYLKLSGVDELPYMDYIFYIRTLN